MHTKNMERATFKIEIPFTDHAHCIGRQGNQIQSIMLATDTHIHFPDGNREPNGTKSNQVSITGTITSIEQARKRIRDILPMSLKFLISPRELIHIINDDYPLFKYVRRRYGVIVLPRPYAKTGDVYCIVRGLINQPELAEATEYLIQAFYGFESSLIKVTCQTEVSEQYHGYLQTRQQSKDMCIAAIEQYTHATIQFPTTIINTNGYGRRTSVIISGSPTQVCQARKLFDLCLPIILTFEVPIDKEPTRADIAHIKDKLNITTILRTRKDKIGKLVIVQSQEYNTDQLFRARSIILGLSEINNNILPISSINNNNNKNTLFDLNLSSTIFSDLSMPASSIASSSVTTIPTNHLPDSILIPIEPYYTSSTQQIDTLIVPLNKANTTKKPSPIGHERFSLRNLDQDAIICSTNNDQFSSSSIFDASKHQIKSINNPLITPLSQNNCSTKLFTLLRSINLEKYWSTFEHNEITPWPVSLDINNYDNFINHSTSFDLNTSLPYFIDDVNNNIAYLPSCSLLSI
ncbi:unnamed protein product [Rotaria sordida]|uniref:K Homology domain-containing protein n=1 Tax=Rotaria sordida TaxID=392033 RepID=A0A814ZJ40_9BILA|nr:unnamed protein product [Rotaria sordida]